MGLKQEGDSPSRQEVDRLLRKRAYDYSQDSGRALREGLPLPEQLIQIYGNLSVDFYWKMELKTTEERDEAFIKILGYMSMHKALDKLGLPGITYTHIDSLIEKLEGEEKEKYTKLVEEYREELNHAAAFAQLPH